MTEREPNKALRWVEQHYPSATGNVKARLILAYGAGLDAGLAEAQEVIAETVREFGLVPMSTGSTKSGRRRRDSTA